MTSRTWVDRGLLLMLAGGFSLALLLQAGAQTLLSDKKPDAAAAEVNAAADDEDADTARPNKPISRIWSSTGASSMSMLPPWPTIRRRRRPVRRWPDRTPR
jgi:hypothetical protein